MAVASNTLRESLRHRVLYALIGASFLMMLVSLILGFVMPEEEDRIRVVLSFNLTSISILSLLAAIFLGTNLIYQEIENRTIYTLLARPLSRTEFIVGKFVGLVIVNTISITLMGLIFVIFIVVNNYPMSASIFVALFTNLLELSVVTAIALLLSVIAHPIEGAFLALIIIVIGHSTSGLKQLKEEIIKKTGDSGTVQQIGLWAIDFFYYVFPNLDNFNLRSLVANDLPMSSKVWQVVGLDLVYAGVYSALLLYFSVLAFRQKTL